MKLRDASDVDLKQTMKQYVYVFHIIIKYNICWLDAALMEDSSMFADEAEEVNISSTSSG